VNAKARFVLLQTASILMSRFSPGMLPRSGYVPVLQRAALSTLLLVQPQTGAERALEFESVGKAAPVASEPKTAVVFIAGRLRQTESFRRWMTTEHADALAAIDFNSRAAIAVFRGTVGMSGYAITIQNVKAEQQRLEIVVKLQDPPPNRMGHAAFTSPYHVVTVPKGAMEDREPEGWTLRDTDGQVLARMP
jgi:hypothetical protein